MGRSPARGGPPPSYGRLRGTGKSQSAGRGRRVDAIAVIYGPPPRRTRQAVFSLTPLAPGILVWYRRGSCLRLVPPVPRPEAAAATLDRDPRNLSRVRRALRGRPLRAPGRRGDVGHLGRSPGGRSGERADRTGRVSDGAPQ